MCDPAYDPKVDGDKATCRNCCTYFKFDNPHYPTEIICSYAGHNLPTAEGKWCHHWYRVNYRKLVENAVAILTEDGKVCGLCEKCGKRLPWKEEFVLDLCESCEE